MEAQKILRIRQVLWAFFGAYSLGLCIRLVEYAPWQELYLWVNGEPLMATHDAYAWLAGAKGSGKLYAWPMSKMLSFLHNLTGISLGKINFFLPALIAPLAALPLCVLCVYWGIAEAGMVAGLLAVLSPGFFLRTRLGFGDTDILTLFLALCFVVALVIYLDPWINRWKRTDCCLSGEKELFFKQWLKALAPGLVFLIYMWFYPNGYPIAMYSLILAFCLGIFLVSNLRELLCGSAAIIIALGKLGLPGIVYVLGILALAKYKKDIIQTKKIGLVSLVVVLVLLPLLSGGLSVYTQLLEPVLKYAKVFTVVEKENLLKLPEVLQSVREAQNIPLTQIVSRVGINWIIFLPGFAGYLFLVWKRPLALLFLPMLGLSLVSFKLGNRFVMYGGGIIGLGLGFLLYQARVRFNISRNLAWLANLVLCLGLAWPVWSMSQLLRPSPILPKVYAQEFLKLEQNLPANAWLWQWWDYGYAAQYYAGRRTFGDGGDHSGPYLYPLALVHSTHSPLQANQMIKFIASSIKEQERECIANGTKPINEGAKQLYYPVNHLKTLEEMGPIRGQIFVDKLARENLVWGDFDPQYFILSWENLRLAYWITYFGNWNLVTGKGVHGKILRLYGRVNLDIKNGVIHSKMGIIPLKSLDIIDDTKKIKHWAWPKEKGWYAILNQLSREVFVLDKTVYYSMLVQMLIRDEQEFQPYFELVSENYPWVRVYKVK